MKNVLLIIVDALASWVVKPALEDGALPNLKALVDAGQVCWDSVSIFPSLTLAAKPSIVTGKYPRHHHMVGAYWYDREANETIYYGGDFWLLTKQGFGSALKDFLGRLNQDQVKAQTIFERLADADQKAANLNWFIFRGTCEHTAHIPPTLNIPLNVSETKTIYGPQTLYLGDFVQGGSYSLDDSDNDGLMNRVGFNDAVTAYLLRKMANDRQFPPFTLAYFPDNDFDSHEQGPQEALSTLKQFDTYLGQLFEAYGGMEMMLNDLILVISGDHAQTPIDSDDAQATINLVDVLDDFSLAPFQQGWDLDEELIICPNGRAAQIYVREPDLDHLEAVIEVLSQHERIDQIMYINDEDQYTVVTRDRGRLRFWQDDSGDVQDRFGGGWSYTGDLATLDGQVDDGKIMFPQYPNAFERIAGVLDAETSGEIWLTAHAGSEFIMPGLESHVGGGGHGALHKDDSISPLIVSSNEISLPPMTRAVDLIPLSLMLREVEADFPLGAPHR